MVDIKVGHQIAGNLLTEHGIEIPEDIFTDFGLLIYKKEQPVIAGGSGCGCSATITYGHLLKRMKQGECKRILVGAILSGLGWYEPIIKFAGAGASVSISSFGNSIVKGALAEVERSVIIGVLTGIFEVTSAGISAAIVFGFMSSLIFKPKG